MYIYIWSKKIASTPQYCNDTAEYGNSEIQTDAIKIQNIQKYVYIYIWSKKIASTPQYCNDTAEYGNSEIQADVIKYKTYKNMYIYMIKENCKFTPILQQQFKNIAIFERH